MLEYKVDNSHFILHYQELREQYQKIVGYTDGVFMEQLPEILHTACIICYLKEIPGYICLSDKGIIHEITHLLHIPEENTTTLAEIRELFRVQLMLS